MKKLLLSLLIIPSILSGLVSQPLIEVNYTPEVAGTDLIHGRLLVLLSTIDASEPRFHINDGPNTQLVYGQDVEGWAAQESHRFSLDSYGYPIENLRDIPPGTYRLQVLINRYEYFVKGNGDRLLLPPDQGEGQVWNRKPGNLYSTPQEITIGEGGRFVRVSVELDQIIPEITPPEDTEYVKHVRIKSELLSEFWGRDMYLGAHVLLPEGWADHPNSKYPLAIMHGHFPADFGGWRTEPPDPNLVPDTSARFGLTGYNRIVQEENYAFYKEWTGPDFPRVLAVTIQHANPFYDDSYAVNSENVGPYGDAITYELIPYIEDKFRGIGEGWARFVYGGSTGGWEALAVQVKYPSEYGSCYASCPDPIDFNAYCLVNLYEDKNAYYLESDFKQPLRPGRRDYLGQVSTTVRDMNLSELALGSNTRSGQQFDVWEAVYSPVGADGYPARIWDKRSGEINHDVAAYWKENYDLAHIIQRDWNEKGNEWAGKIHIYCGDMDNYYLNNAVYLAEDMLKNLQNPTYDGEVEYGDRAEHCWNGDHEQPNHISRLRYHSMYIKKWVKEDMPKHAPDGVDITSWRY